MVKKIVEVDFSSIPEQDQKSLSAPGPYCLCQARASSWSGDSVQTQDCYTQSCSCETWIVYGSFTVRRGPSTVKHDETDLYCTA